jgi:hypothetical protein
MKSMKGMKRGTPFLIEAISRVSFKSFKVFMVIALEHLRP